MVDLWQTWLSAMIVFQHWLAHPDDLADFQPLKASDSLSVHFALPSISPWKKPAFVRLAKKVLYSPVSFSA
jgi:hypothetical protein